MLDFVSLLATAADAAPSASDQTSLTSILGWVTSFVLAVLGVVLRYTGKIEGRREMKERLQGNVTIDGKVNTQEHQEVATRNDLNELRKEKNAEIDQLHSRMNMAFRILDRLGGTVDGIGDNVGRLLDIQLNLPPGTTAKKTRAKSTE